jgi:hypothetical protein
MTKSDLLKRLAPLSDDAVIVITDGEGWTNIDRLTFDGVCIQLHVERFPLFSDN